MILLKKKDLINKLKIMLNISADIRWNIDTKINFSVANEYCNVFTYIDNLQPNTDKYSFTLDCSDLISVLSKYKDENVSIEINGTSMIVNEQLTLLTKEVEVDINNPFIISSTLELPSTTFKNIFAALHSCIDNSPVGIYDVLYMHAKDNIIEAFGSDTIRFIKIKQNIDTQKNSFSLSIGKFIFNLLNKILNDDCLIKFHKSAEGIFIEANNIFISTKESTLKLPNFKLLEDKFTLDKVLNTSLNQMLYTISKAEVVARKNEYIKYYSVLSIKKNSITIMAKNSLMLFEEKIDAIFSGEEERIPLNLKTLKELLMIFQQEVLTIRLFKCGNPIKLINGDIEAFFSTFSEII